MNYLIVGGTGFIGKNFICALDKSENKVFVFSTTSYKKIKNCHMIRDLNSISEDEQIDVIINLGGENIYSIWTPSKKDKLYSGKVNTAEQLVKLVERLKAKPQIMITASSLCYYGPNHKEIITENTYPLKSYFYSLYNTIESTGDDVKNFGTRHCIIRMGIVIGKSGGFFKKIRWPFLCGVGTKFGTGEQNISWIHIFDVIAAIYHLVYNKNSQGIYNLCSPNYLSNLTFTEKLKSFFKRKFVVNFSEKIIKLFFKQMGKELLLGNYKAKPQRLLNENFEFKYLNFDEALNSLKKEI